MDFVGKERTEEDFHRLLIGLGVKKQFKTTTQELRFSYRQHGLDLVFCNRDHLRAVEFFDRRLNLSGFQGSLPFGLEFNTVREEVRDLFGSPHQTEKERDHFLRDGERIHVRVHYRKNTFADQIIESVMVSLVEVQHPLHPGSE